ncbi:UDP-glycosyltransferase UGT5-like [Diabrotica undecimpunctata]|uniref:UDP-glycosyltransferase UGT5-like n=1 Tax=Diabrotica undecimpunctata TaxID=50387 RepID=UPI003B6378D5
MRAHLFLIFLLKIISNVSGYEILVVFPSPVPSHYILGNALARGLANAGHSVTMVSSFEEKDPPKNGSYKDVVLTGMIDMMKDLNAPQWMEFGDMNPIKIIYLMDTPGHAITNFTLRHPNFRELLNSGKTFDVIILEQFLNDALKVLGCHFNAPVIPLGTCTPSMWVNQPSGNPEVPSYVPDLYQDFPTRMNIWQRGMNSLFVVARRIMNDFIFLPVQEEFVNQHFPHCAKGKDFYYDVSLTLVNHHETINDPRPLVPSMIAIGGFHINPPKKLPKELQIFLDEAKEGVIYFSVGSNVMPSSLGNATVEAIVNALKKRKEKVLWKWDDSVFSSKPANFKVGKWFSQQDVLAHPNVKLFITHGGLLSLQEAVYNAVPVLVLPIFADQFRNGILVEENGLGLNLPIRTVTEPALVDKIDRIMSDSKYKENMQKRSKLFRSRPVNPLDLAIFWVEYVAENKGAPHLKVQYLNIEWYKILLLDVIALFSTIALIAAVIGYFILRKLLKVLLGSKEKVKRQ